MSDNRFADCDNPGLVLSQHVLKCNSAGTISETLRLRDDALARIAELTGPDEAARKRAIEMLSAEFGIGATEQRAERAVDRIIDALDLTRADTPTPDPKHGVGCGCYWCEKPEGVSPPPTDDDDGVHRLGHTPMCGHIEPVASVADEPAPTPAPVPVDACADVDAPVVELDADTLRTLSKLLKRWNDIADDIGILPGDNPSLALEMHPGRIVAADGCWVLRIGGGDE